MTSTLDRLLQQSQGGASSQSAPSGGGSTLDNLLNQSQQSSTPTVSSMAGGGSHSGMPSTLAQLEHDILSGHRAGQGGFMGNLGRDIMGFATGLPSMLQMGARTLAAGSGIPELYGMSHLPGSGAASRFGSNVAHQDRAVLENLLSGYRQSYSPTFMALLRGHPIGAVQHLGAQAYQHPFNTALDALTVAGGIGAAAKVGELGVAAGRAGMAFDPAIETADASRLAAIRTAMKEAYFKQHSINPQGMTSSSGDQIYGRRLRNPDQFVTSQQGFQTQIPFGQAPFSKNPLIRALVQKPFAKTMERLGGDLPQYTGGTYNYLPQSVVANRAAGRIGRGLAGGIGAEAARMEKLTPELRSYAKAVKALKGDPLRPGSKITAELQQESLKWHLRGIKGPQDIQKLIDHYDTAISHSKANGEITVAREASVQKLRKIAAEPKLHSPDPSSTLGKAIDAGKQLAPIEKTAARNAYNMTEAQMADRSLLPQRVVLGSKGTPYPTAMSTPAAETAVFRDMPAEATAGTSKSVFSRNLRKITQTKVYHNTGALMEHANAESTPLALIEQTLRSWNIIGANDASAKLMDVAAYRDANGLPIVGTQDQLGRMFAPNEAVFVSRDALRKQLSMLESDPNPQMGAAKTLSDILDGSHPTTTSDPNSVYIALNKHAVDEFQARLQPSGLVGHGFDVVQGLWKDAVLALSPRWYVHVTAGHSIQYALGAGPRDIASILKTVRMTPELRSVIEKHYSDIATGLTMGGTRIDQSWVAGLFHINDQIQFRIRTAMAVAMGRKVFRAEGRGAEMSMRLSSAEMATALERIATDPKMSFMRDEILRQSLQFVGDYLNFSPFERSVMKRIFPFYSWLRVIGKLTVALPLHHPLMANAVATLGRASEPVVDPLDPFLPVYRRGAINMPGFSMATSGMNPFGTIADLAAGGITTGLTGMVSSLAQGSESPLLQMLLEHQTKQNAFTGDAFSAPPGWGGGAAPFGQTPEAINPVTGLPEPIHPIPDWLQSLFSNLVPQESVVRGALASGAPGAPYDTTSDLTMLLNRLGIEHTPANQMFMPPSKTGGSGVVSPSMGPAISYATGFPTFIENPQQMLRSAMLSYQRLQQGQHQNQTQLAKNAQRLAASHGKPLLP